ncbi:MAG: aminoacyl-tRNA hydrolase [Clostridiales bacterium]|jgi:PTH1 family peptidyl-tRNA hydrolase|nr:aminoacyl-tRNA hydrolase [Clostridiales bacterium]
MRLIFGLGNPGRDYERTRHNTGFEVIGKLAADHGIAINRAKFRGAYGDGFIAGEAVKLVMPLTFMNLSGECVRDFAEYFHVPAADLIVVYDDIALPPGNIRVRAKGSAGGHNGMKNIIYHLETDEFPRVRVGVGPPPEGWDLIDHVLSRFTDRETEAFVSGATDAADAVGAIISEGIGRAMAKFNRRREKPPGEGNG